MFLNSHSLQTVDFLIHLLIVPLDGTYLVEVVDGGQGVDDVGSEERVDVFRLELGRALSVLSPVCHVTHQLGGGS